MIHSKKITVKPWLFIILAMVALTGCGGASSGTAAVLLPGEKTYNRSCVTCHQPDGKGLRGGRPFGGDFTEAGGILAKSDEVLIQSVLEGYQGELGRMPAFKPVLTPQQAKDVVGYIRGRFGKKTD